MKEIISYMDGILQNYNISYDEFSKYPSSYLSIETSDPHRLQQFIKRRFHKQIGLGDARELEMLFLTYNYVS